MPWSPFPPFGVPLSASACFLAAVLVSCLQRTALVCWTVSPTDEESWQCQRVYISLGRTHSRWMAGWQQHEGPAILLWGQTLKYSLLSRLPLGSGCTWDSAWECTLSRLLFPPVLLPQLPYRSPQAALPSQIIDTKSSPLGQLLGSRPKT